MHTNVPVEQLRWRTSSYSMNNAACVDVAFASTAVLVRDTKDAGTGPVIQVSVDQWRTFLHEVLTGTPAKDGVLRAERINKPVTSAHGQPVRARWQVRDLSTEVTLHFTEEEWIAFRRGAAYGEFNHDTRPLPANC